MTPFEQRYRRRVHGAFVAILLLHIPACSIVASYFGLAVGLVTGLGVAIAAGPVLLFALAPSSRWTGVAIAVASQCFSALLIHSGRGMIEMHFHVFVSIAALVTLADWVVVASAAATIAVHHVLFYLLLPASVFNYAAGLGIVVVHAAFVVLETVPACLVSARFRRLLQAQGSVLQTLRTAARAITDHTNDLTATTQALATGSEEQATSIQATGASIDEMSAMTGRNAESAQKAKLLAAQTRAAVEANVATMEEMNASMLAIKSANDNIAKIIRVIDEIAFQTNILALNAAVEAARAGEAGQGFSVVADEVRNLAQRSAGAARETADKIQDSMSKGELGARHSQRVAEGLRGIVANIREVDNLLGGIAVASQEQSRGIEQVNAAVSQIDRVTQASAAGATRTTGTVHQLGLLAGELNGALADLDRLLGDGTPETPRAAEEPDGGPRSAPVPDAPVGGEAAPDQGSGRRSKSELVTSAADKMDF
jgi:hypothetical protein